MKYIWNYIYTYYIYTYICIFINNTRATGSDTEYFGREDCLNINSILHISYGWGSGF